MAAIKVGIVFLFCIVALCTAEPCQMTDEYLMTQAVKCMAGDFELAGAFFIAEKNPNEKAKVDFICNHVSGMVDIIHCMADRLIPCVPDQLQSIVRNVLPAKDSLTRFFTTVCNNREALNDECIEEHSTSVMQCSNGLLSHLVQGGRDEILKAIQKEGNGYMCHVVNIYTGCVDKYDADCSSDHVNVITKAMNDLFSCGAVKPLPPKSAPGLKDILVRGQPLGQFKRGNPLRYWPSRGLQKK